MKETETYCNNCEQNVKGNYCSQCGQRTIIGKLTFSEIFQDLFSSLFTLEAPLIVTIKMLFTNPGTLFREYLSGKRKTYYRPIAFFLLITVLHIFIRSIINYDPFQGVTPQETGQQSATIFFEAGRFMVANINNILFLFVLALAISLKLFFYRKYDFVEYLAISFYLVGVYSLIGTLFLFYLTYVNNKLQSLPMLLMLIYFCISMVSFFQKKKFVVVMKSIFSYVLALLLYVISGFGISLVIVYLSN